MLVIVKQKFVFYFNEISSTTFIALNKIIIDFFKIIPNI